MAGGFFTIVEDLTDARPPHNRGGVGATEELVWLLVDASEVLFAEDVNERKPMRSQKSTNSLTESEVVSIGRRGTQCHENNLPDLTGLARSNQGGLQII